MLLASVAAMTRGKGNAMRTLKIGDVTITSIIERDGPWRQPEGHVSRL
jgi:hypothetical protein